jgi:hypothetical protein
VEFPQTASNARTCIHDVSVWWGHECGICMDEYGVFVWKDDSDATTAVVTGDGVDVHDLAVDEGGAGPDWRVAHVEVRRGGELLCTLQVTPRDVVVFPGTCGNIAIIRRPPGVGKQVATEHSVGIYE